MNNPVTEKATWSNVSPAISLYIVGIAVTVIFAFTLIAVLLLTFKRNQKKTDGDSILTSLGQPAEANAEEKTQNALPASQENEQQEKIPSIYWDTAKSADLQPKTEQSKINLEEKQQNAVQATEEDKVQKQMSAETSAPEQNIILLSKVTPPPQTSSIKTRRKQQTAKKSKAKLPKTKSEQKTQSVNLKIPKAKLPNNDTQQKTEPVTPKKSKAKLPETNAKQKTSPAESKKRKAKKDENNNPEH
jgi:DNA segregation ATPase FtsK/SpoIIIE-like protein